MTAAGAICEFMASFGLEAYDESFVPTGELRPEFPYLTYECPEGYFGDGDVSIAVNLWYRDGGWWERADRKAEEISRSVGRGGKLLPCTGGAVWIKRGSPFSKNLSDPNDDFIQRKYINLTAEFLTYF